MSDFPGPIGQEVFDRTYSRRKPDGTKETWSETVARVVAGNTALVDEAFIEEGERERLTELILSFGLLPAGRHLWVGGVEGRQFSFNCHRTAYGESLRDHLGFMMNVLMTGGGSGSSVSDSAIKELPVPAGQVELYFVATGHKDHAEFASQLVPFPAGTVFRVPDSREGWVESLCQLTDLFEAGGGTITFDVTDVRPRGSLIEGFGGTASGPCPLIQLLTQAAQLLNQRIGQKLTSLDVMKLQHYVGACVISGNVRRSALMTTKSWNDREDIFAFINCKKDSGDHWTTNISVEIDQEFIDATCSTEDPHAMKVYDAVVNGMMENGEPGFFNLALAAEGERDDNLVPNPCGEIALAEWEPCCLGHINLHYFDADLAAAAEAARLMARFLVRATFAQAADPRQRAVVDMNRKIGVGILGYQEWGAAHGLRYSEIYKNEYMGAKLDVLYSAVKIAADSYSDELGIPRSIKTTCVAPTGTVSALAGVTSGIHPIYARHFIRRIRYADNDPLLEEHRAKGRHIEPDMYSENTQVVSIPCQDPIIEHYDSDLIEQADELSPNDMFRTQAFVQKHWADNAVSFTVNIPEGVTTSEVHTALLASLENLKGTTVFPDVSRPQAPYERISIPEFYAMKGAETGQAMDECSTGACPVR
jgi:ribonucleoside-triphosphate reductase